MMKIDILISNFLNGFILKFQNFRSSADFNGNKLDLIFLKAYFQFLNFMFFYSHEISIHNLLKINFKILTRLSKIKSICVFCTTHHFKTLPHNRLPRTSVFFWFLCGWAALTLFLPPSPSLFCFESEGGESYLFLFSLLHTIFSISNLYNFFLCEIFSNIFFGTEKKARRQLVFVCDGSGWMCC